MAKKKSPPPTPPTESVEKRGSREVLYYEGDFHYLSRNGFKSAKFKAVFKDDPQGCYGFGNTKDTARAMLYDYAEMHGESQ